MKHIGSVPVLVGDSTASKIHSLRGSEYICESGPPALVEAAYRSTNVILTLANHA